MKEVKVLGPGCPKCQELMEQTEKAIQEGLHALRETSTIIIIAQRFSSVESADRVCVFESGKLVEDGTPASLNRQGTAFSRILDAPAGGTS